VRPDVRVWVLAGSLLLALSEATALTGTLRDVAAWPCRGLGAVGPKEVRLPTSGRLESTAASHTPPPIKTPQRMQETSVYHRMSPIWPDPRIQPVGAGTHWRCSQRRASRRGSRL